ncbi:hypothetical protein BLNAU_22536 [Blattamonas nauphoetae]|uniref:Uncharacterized protein n=1 Tax=Blattamonas nauphoetae TaxID=2049346 RepID=A0ABQ9WTV5_9EUKA|nr:hypothetical protein BLNAU_22536 [Blattamonas nauphoetae]
MWGTSHFEKQSDERCGRSQWLIEKSVDIHRTAHKLLERQELFGERTIDDKTLKDSRVENDEPKTANHFEKHSRHPRRVRRKELESFERGGIDASFQR